MKPDDCFCLKLDLIVKVSFLHGVFGQILSLSHSVCSSPVHASSCWLRLLFLPGSFFMEEIGGHISPGGNISVTHLPLSLPPLSPSLVCDVIRGEEVTVHQSTSSLLLDNTLLIMLKMIRNNSVSLLTSSSGRNHQSWRLDIHHCGFISSALQTFIRVEEK